MSNNTTNQFQQIIPVEITKRTNSFLINTIQKTIFERVYLNAAKSLYAVHNPDTGYWKTDVIERDLEEYICEAIEGSTYDPVNRAIIFHKNSIQYNISKEDIESFVKNRLARKFNDRINVPFYPTHLDKAGTHVLNVWKKNAIEADSSTDIEKGKPFFDWLYYLICGGLNVEDKVSKTMVDYLDIIDADFDSLTEQEKHFQILTHWCAARVQSPLTSATTVPLLVSTAQSIGKSTLASITGRLIDYGFARSMDTAAFLGDWDNSLVKPGIIDVSDLKNVSPSKVEQRIKERVRPSQGLFSFNVKSKEQQEGYYHVSFIITANTHNFVLLTKGETSRMYLIDGISAINKKNKVDVVDGILSKMKQLFPSDNLPIDPSGDHLEFLQGIRRVFDGINVNQKMVSESDSYQPAKMKEVISYYSDTLEKMVKNNYNRLKEYETRQSKAGRTSPMKISELCKVMIEDYNSATHKAERNQLTAMLLRERDDDLVRVSPNKDRFSIKLIKFDPNDIGNQIDYGEDENENENDSSNVVSISERINPEANNIKEKAIGRLESLKGRK